MAPAAIRFGSILALGVLLALFASCTESELPPAVQGFAPVRDGQLYYQVRGHGAPVVLIHGGSLQHGMWDDQFDLLAQDFRVVRYDVRGFGKSGSPETPHSQWEDLRALLEHLSIERTHIVGLSLGGKIAVDFALEYPEKVDRLVLAGPGLSGWRFEPAPWIEELGQAIEAGDQRAAAEAWLRSPHLAAAMENPEVAERVRRLTLENERAFVPVFKAYEPDPPATERLQELEAPVLLVVGTRDDVEIGRIADRLVEQVPDLRKIAIEGAGHMVNMERPEEFNRAVLDFLLE
jgi:pimeloyl-ACP methyl ester carboxylesterase